MLNGQGYDGASSMSGKFQGVQAIILEDQPFAFYTHCYGHVLNLCVADVCENRLVNNATVKQVINFFQNHQKDYVYFRKLRKILIQNMINYYLYVKPAG